MRNRRRTLVLALVSAAVAAAPARAEWIVFVGGGIREIQGALDVRGRQVRFHDVSGTLMSVAADDVDVAASAFLSAQVGRSPAPASGAAPGPTAGGRPGAPCAAVRLVRIATAETYEIEIGGRVETIHLACIDAPETRHRIPDLAFFGHEAAARVEQLLATAPSLCLIEDDPPRRDAADHRVAYLRTGDGRDLGAEIVRRGFAVARAGNCGRVGDYLALEARARAGQLGHWGPSANGAAVAVVASSVAFQGMPPARRGGGRS